MGERRCLKALSSGCRVHVSATKLCAFLLCSAPHDERCSLSEHSIRARKKLLGSCSLLKETIFRRGLDADRGITRVPRISYSRLALAGQLSFHRVKLNDQSNRAFLRHPVA